MREIGDVAIANGWESYVAYSGGRDGLVQCSSQAVPVGNKWDVLFHGCSTRLFDRHGLGSVCVTKRFIEQLEEMDPDIIHIHNIHGYFLNYKILFGYLKRCNKLVVWTVHDCWLYTGHCYHYASAKCGRWVGGCGRCPQRGEFPKSWFIDRSAKNFLDKKKAFTSLKPENFVIVTVSEWMREEMKRSFLSDYPFRVIHNGIDLDVFRPIVRGTKCFTRGTDCFTRGTQCSTDFVTYLGVASIWLDEKGLPDLIRMSGMLNSDERMVLVGKLPKGMKQGLPKNVTHVPRTENVTELARMYSEASVFLNPTWQDNYPTVNLEAQACGTPVVTYRTGGSPESLTPATGAVVEQGDVDGMLAQARRFAAMDRDVVRGACREHALRNFAKTDRYNDYIELYQSML